MAYLRLANVHIENRHYSKIINSSDRPHTFFYIDPPYYNCEDYYGDGIFSKEDFTKLRDLLLQIKGKFIMSINDEPKIRELYKDFNIEEVKTTYSLNGAHKKKKVTELLIMNYDYKKM